MFLKYKDDLLHICDQFPDFNNDYNNHKQPKIEDKQEESKPVGTEEKLEKKSRFERLKRMNTEKSLSRSSPAILQKRQSLKLMMNGEPSPGGTDRTITQRMSTSLIINQKFALKNLGERDVDVMLKSVVKKK